MSNRRLINTERTDDLEVQARRIIDNRFNGERPADLKAERFTEDSSGVGVALRAAIAHIFDDREQKLDPERMAHLEETFGTSVAIWERAGLFTETRATAGYQKPNFARDYESRIDAETLALMEKGTGLNQGYHTAVWAPMDVPLYSKNPETLSYLGLLKQALERAFHGTAGGKKPDTLRVGSMKTVLTGKQVNVRDILQIGEIYKYKDVVYEPQELTQDGHHGKTERELIENLAGAEKKTGGTVRLEREWPVTPGEMDQKRMNAEQWAVLMKEQQKLPDGVSAQNLKQAIAYIIYCLETEGWVPDLYSYNSQNILITPGTYIPDELSVMPAWIRRIFTLLRPNEDGIGAVPALFWNSTLKRFTVYRARQDMQSEQFGVRLGKRVQ